MGWRGEAQRLKRSLTRMSERLFGIRFAVPSDFMKVGILMLCSTLFVKQIQQQHGSARFTIRFG